MVIRMANPKDRETIHSLRLSIKEALDALTEEHNTLNGSVLAIQILSAAYEFTDPKLLDKDCGCG